MCVSEPAKPHVLLIPFPAQGHFPPIIHLSRKLAELGCVVTIVNLACLHEQLKVWQIPAELDIRLEALHPEMDMSRGVLAAFEEDTIGFMASVKNLEEEFRLLMKKLMEEANPVSCVVSDHYVGAWPLSVATDFGVRHAVYWPGSATWFSLELHLQLLDSRGDLAFNEETEGDDRVISYVPGVDSIKRSQLPFHYTPESVEYLGDAAKRLEKSSWILCNTFYELEPKAVDAMQEIFDGKFLPIGPLFPVEDHESRDLLSVLSFISEDKKCLSWLDEQQPKSVIYISFGSIATLSQMQLEELTEGLEASGMSFVLTIRPQLVKDLCPDFYRKFVERTQGRSLIVSWAPQREVLKHPAIAGFMTHCGWNSVMESTCRGVAMLCWPCIFEQNLNCWIAEERKLGVALKRGGDGIVRKEEVQSVVSSVCSLEEVKAEVMRLSEAAKASAAKRGGSYMNLLSFVQGQ